MFRSVPCRFPGDGKRHGGAVERIRARSVQARHFAHFRNFFRVPRRRDVVRKCHFPFGASPNGKRYGRNQDGSERVSTERCPERGRGHKFMMTYFTAHILVRSTLSLAPSARVLSIGISRRVRRNASCGKRSCVLVVLLLALPSPRKGQGLADIGL